MNRLTSQIVGNIADSLGIDCRTSEGRDMLAWGDETKDQFIARLIPLLGNDHFSDLAQDAFCGANMALLYTDELAFTKHLKDSIYLSIEADLRGKVSELLAEWRWECELSAREDFEFNRRKEVIEYVA